MSQRRSRRIAGQEPSLVDEEESRRVYDQLLTLDYSEEQAHELISINVDDLDCFESLSLFAQLRTKGFDHDQANDLTSFVGRPQMAMTIHDGLLPLFNDDTVAANFAMMWIGMLIDGSSPGDNIVFQATCTAQRMIAKGTIKVEKEELDDDGGIFVGVGAYVDQSSSVLLAQDQEILLPAFNKLAAAINNTTDRHGSITLCFQYIELSKEVLDMLLIDGPLRKLILQNNNLFENDGVDDFVSVVSKDSSLESINILNNLIKREEDAQSLVNTMIDHPKLKYIMLDSCGLGCNDSVMKSIVPLIGSMDQITLDDNQIGSSGVKLISDCIASNPMLTLLSLKDNLLNDADADILAKSLKSNTNLRILEIAGNNISEVGMKSFHSAVEDLSGFNAMSESNHTCLLDDKKLSELNTKYNPKLNKVMKLMDVLVVESNMPHLSTIPIELMPRVLFLVQGRGFFDTPSLSRTFKFIRQWSMPLLYTSCVGFEPRRSERVRKKMVMDYMVVK